MKHEDRDRNRRERVARLMWFTFGVVLTATGLFFATTFHARGAEREHDRIAWTLPFSCESAKDYASRYTRAQLEVMRAAAGWPKPTHSQRKQLVACVTGRLD